MITQYANSILARHLALINERWCRDGHFLDTTRQKNICRNCTDRPNGCWKNQEFGCEHDRNREESQAVTNGTCPIGKWDVPQPTEIDEQFFDRAVVISLASDAARLAGFHERLSTAKWPFAEPVVFSAIDGRQVSMPSNWRLSPGAFGCLLSHRMVIDQAVADGIRRLMVFEDDCTFREGFVERVKAFIASVPDDWQEIMLGGSARNGALEPIASGIARCRSAYRNHAYALQGDYLVAVRDALHRSSWHCDIIMERMQREHRVYAPLPWLCGQSGGISSIGPTQRPTFYDRDAAIKKPVVHSRPSSPCLVCSINDPIPEPEQAQTPRDWAWRTDVRDMHIAALHEITSRDYLPPDDLQGDGIVTVSAGAKFWPMTVIATQMLRQVNSTMPLQIWHDGNIGQELNFDPYTKLIDVREFRKYHPPRIDRGWELKSYALLHSGFQRVFWLDADAYVVADPAPAFATLKQAPIAYWIDLARTWHNVKWEWYGIDHETVKVPPIQGGHALIDMQAGWKMMMIVHWINMHSDQFFKHQFGDQDSYRVALALTELPFATIGHAMWQRIAFTCYLPGWNPLVVHRCRSKIKPSAEPKSWDGLPKEAEMLKLVHAMMQPKYGNEGIVASMSNSHALANKIATIRAMRAKKKSRAKVCQSAISRQE